MAPTAAPPSTPPVSVAQVLPSPDVSLATQQPTEAEAEDCLSGDSVINPIIPKEPVPVFAAAEPSALMDDDSVS